MAENSKIEWTDHTFNPWIGCRAISPGCKHCYAEAYAKRVGRNFAARTRTSEANWRLPLKWNSQPWPMEGADHRRPRVFCASLADVFDNEVDPLWRADLFELIDKTPNLDWLLLTKRIGNVNAMLTQILRPETMPANVWLGATVVNQEEADRDIPKLLATPARVRFLSIEPMLGPVDLSRVMAIPHNAPVNVLRPKGCAQHAPGYCLGDCPWRWRGLDWIICGGESGHGARPMHPDWARSLRDQCAAAGVPFLFKQWGEWLPVNQMDDEFMNRLYKPNRVAKLHEDQSALNDCYGRRCAVPQGVHQADGTLLDIAAPMAFREGLGSMQIFKVGKNAAGRLLDGVQHDGFPLQRVRT